MLCFAHGLDHDKQELVSTGTPLLWLGSPVILKKGRSLYASALWNDTTATGDSIDYITTAAYATNLGTP